MQFGKVSVREASESEELDKASKGAWMEETSLSERSWERACREFGYCVGFLRSKDSATQTQAHIGNHGNHPEGCKLKGTSRTTARLNRSAFRWGGVIRMS